MAKRLSKLKFHQDIHAKTYNDKISKPQQKYCLGTFSKNLIGGWGMGVGGLNRFYMATTLVLTSDVVYTRHLFSPREGFLTHQCNISENIKIIRIQRWNNDEDSTARNNWNAGAKENQQLDSGGPDQSQNIRHQPTYLKVFRPEPS